MASDKSQPMGGAEATLKALDYIEDEALNIQYSIWGNRPLKATRQLRKLSKEADFLETQILGLYRALSSLERSLEEMAEDGIYAQAPDGPPPSTQEPPRSADSSIVVPE